MHLFLVVELARIPILYYAWCGVTRLDICTCMYMPNTTLLLKCFCYVVCLLIYLKWFKARMCPCVQTSSIKTRFWSVWCGVTPHYWTPLGWTGTPKRWGQTGGTLKTWWVRSSHPRSVPDLTKISWKAFPGEWRLVKPQNGTNSILIGKYLEEDVQQDVQTFNHILWFQANDHCFKSLSMFGGCIVQAMIFLEVYSSLCIYWGYFLVQISLVSPLFIAISFSFWLIPQGAWLSYWVSGWTRLVTSSWLLHVCSSLAKMLNINYVG